MDSHLHNLQNGGSYVSKKLVGRSIPWLAKKAFHSFGVTLTSPKLTLQQTQLLQHSPYMLQSSHGSQTQSSCCLAPQRLQGLFSLILCCNLPLITLHNDRGQITQSGWGWAGSAVSCSSSPQEVSALTIVSSSLVSLTRVAEVAREHGWHPPKSLDSDENFKPEHALFCRELRFVKIYALFFRDLWA